MLFRCFHWVGQSDKIFGGAVRYDIVECFPCRRRVAVIVVFDFVCICPRDGDTSTICMCKNFSVFHNIVQSVTWDYCLNLAPTSHFLSFGKFHLR